MYTCRGKKDALFYEDITDKARGEVLLSTLVSNLVLNSRSIRSIQLEFRNVDFYGGRKTGELGKKPSKQVRESTIILTHI
jgi:peptidoglycan hydrolase-like protein with peptidoglycan-binding domain